MEHHRQPHVPHRRRETPQPLVRHAALLQQRGVMTLHASAIETQAGAVLFAGPSGIGKSSLAAALVERGNTMLADDVTGVVLDAAGRPVALSAFPVARQYQTLNPRAGTPLPSEPVMLTVQRYWRRRCAPGSAAGISA